MGLVTGAIGTLLPKLVELLKKEYGLQKGVKDKIHSLSKELEVAHAVLRKIGDVPPEQVHELVKLWARDVREASYDMEDIVDSFLVSIDAPDEPTDPQMLRRIRKKVGSLFQKSKARRKISRLIQDIAKKLDEVAAMRGRYTLDNFASMPVGATSVDPRLLNLYKTASELIGLERPTSDLIDMLSLGGDDGVFDKKMKILSIFGFGGLGKTTLAKSVYDQLKPRFERAAFVPVGQNPDKKKVLRDILIGLDKGIYTNSNMTVLDERQLIDELKEFVKEKRCFIVIDDIWDKDPWKLIRCAVQEIGCGSRLIITTRKYEVATYAGDKVYKIQPLSPENSEKLLYARIAGGGVRKYFDNPSDQVVGRILKKCGGVPLAIITIASLLASKPSEYWSEVYSSIGFGHEDNDDVDNTRRILSFSYYDLPSHLKPCLLYLSIFPEDITIKKNSLIWRWAAEGFIIISEDQEAEGVGLFELGERYFYDLVNRSMIQPVEREDYSGTGYVYGCSVHDMVLDLIQSISSNENFVTILDGDEGQKLPRNIARRLALQKVDWRSGGQLGNITMEKVRSLVAEKCEFRVPPWTHLPVLRVLEINYYYVQEDCDGGLLDGIGRLLHLRYLGVQDYGDNITKLPKKVIRYLKFLQTLDLSGSYGMYKMPEEVGLLTQLVCLRLGLDLRRMPDGVIGKLTSLQELEIHLFPETMQFVKELGSLKGLRILSCGINIGDEIESVIGDETESVIGDETESVTRALLDSLGNLHNIRELEIVDSIGNMMNETSHAGFISCRHVRFLRLDWFTFSVLPPWIKSSLAPNLSYLEVNLLVVKEQDMETLARLPELCSLVLHSYGDTKLVIVSIKIHTEGVGYFPKLRFLKISGRTSILFNLQGIECNNSMIASTVMPCLESLEVNVHVRSIKDATHQHQLDFDKLIGFDNLGRTSLRIVTVYVHCGDAIAEQVMKAEAALRHAATVHPKHPTLRTFRENEVGVLGPEVPCQEVEKAEAALGHAATVHPKHPTLETFRQEEEYRPWPEVPCQECMDVSINPGPVDKIWKNRAINIRSGHIQALRVTDPTASSSKVIRLLYTQEGWGLWALDSNDVIKLWKWPRCYKCSRGKATTYAPPQLWQPGDGIVVANDPCNGNPEEATACIALSKNDCYLVSASGGRLSLFNTLTFKVMTTFMPPPPAATFIAFNPQDNNIMAIGTEDSSIQIYDVRTDEVQMVLRGHEKKISGLAFSQVKNVLVSSGADAQLCVWSMDGWEKMNSRYNQPPANHSGALVGDTTVQFHPDQIHIFVVHGTQLASYDWELEYFCSWSPSDALPSLVSSAVYSSDGLLVYAGFCDGAIGIFEAKSLTLQCRIAPSAYIPSSVSSGETVYPMAIAANPWKPSQMAVGMSDGAVYVLEPPLDTDIKVESNASSRQFPLGGSSNGEGDDQQDVFDQPPR